MRAPLAGACWCAWAQVSPTTLFLLEGCGQLGMAMNWGDGYVTDRALIQAAGSCSGAHPRSGGSRTTW